MSVMFWDLMLLGIFLVLITTFLFIERKKIKREGLLFLYHTQWGVKLIERIGKKYEKPLKILSYVSVVMGYLLMILMIYFFVKILIVYLFQADVVRAIKLPPIAPLIPYLPQIFKLSWLPPFYFSYWVLILAIVAIPHEFFHGIFAKIAKIKVKSTGFGFFPFFFPIFPAAFVSPDEKQLNKAKKFDQMAVLSAGTFANVLTAIVGIALMVGIFAMFFSPTGVVYNDYAYGVVNPNSITSINGVNLTNTTYDKVLNFNISGAQNKIVVGNVTFVGVKGFSSGGEVALYYDSPAIENNLSGAITKIDGKQVTSLDELSSIISSHNVGDNVTVSTFDGRENSEKTIQLQSSPEGKPWIGITFLTQENSGILGFLSMPQSYGNSYVINSTVYFASSPITKFIYDFFWWLVLISFSVALVNMLPVGIFDGGRFFYLTVFAITRSEKVAEKSFKILTAIFIGLLVLLMFFWAKAFF